MKSEWLRQFVSLAETRNFGLAAKKLNLSKASLSINLAKLEAYFGTSLINRDRAFRFLTPAGEELLQRAHFMLAELESLEWGLNQPHLLLSENLRIGWTSPAAESYLLPVLAHIVQERSSVYPSLHELDSNTSEMQLVCGDVDLLFITGCISQSSMIRYQEELNPALTYYVGNPYRYAIVGTPAFENQPWQELPFATALKAEQPGFGPVWDEERYPRRLQALCPSISALVELCEQGECCAFLPIVCVQDQLERGELREVTAAPFQLVCQPYLVSLPQTSEAASAFVSLSQNHFKLLKTKDMYAYGLRHPLS
ncbi:MAG: LysR family transcriptional regulator [Candidatus Sericytochromatia bacterium]